MPASSREFSAYRVGSVWLFAAASLACSAEHDSPQMFAGEPSASGGQAARAVEPCAEGATRSCARTLAQQGSVLSCLNGTQTCKNASWSDCESGTVTLQTAPVKHTRRLFNLSDPVGCSDTNPCDPSCQVYREYPAGPEVAQVNSNAGWWTGDSSQFPADVQSALTSSNCLTAADCQQNQHCVNVATSTTCNHAKCEQGAGLDPTCDPCVQEVCTQNPTCCQSTPARCASDEMQDSAGQCYYHTVTSRNWLGSQSSCRAHGTGWDLACPSTQVQQAFLAANTATDSWLGLARSAAGFTCDAATPLNPGPWRPGEPNNWGGAENCAEIYASDGAWNDIDCSVIMPAWCAGPPTNATDWDATCVNAVASACGATCSTSGAPACVSWNPGQVDAVDASFDLSIDVPCNGQVPVCNHGTVPASGATVHVMTPDLAQVSRRTPDLTTQLGQCSTAAQIAPGACVMVDGCSALLTQNNAALWVEASGAGESRTDDNWGYSVVGTGCVLPHCLGTAGSEPCVTVVTFSEDYQGACEGFGTMPQWSYLQFRAETPGDSSIRFQVAAAPSQAELDTAAPIDLIAASQATAAVGTDVTQCLISGSSPNCPVDLYQVLQPIGNANSEHLRLIVTLTPSSDSTQSPVLDYWRINYACPDET